ncbi:MAG TPA: hypothetical protein VI980_10925 [Acidimicrobiia bacterium]|nr:hypothetical protein [Acidimicrobiia bacterium]
MEEQPNPDQELESVLREAGRELTEEAAEDERLTELLRRRRLALADLALEWVHRGQRVRAEAGTQTFSGQVVFAGTDYVTIERIEDQVALRLDRATWTLEPEHGEGHEQTGGATSLKARLSEIAATGETVRLIIAEGRALVGSVVVVAADQVEVRQDHLNVVVPIDLVLAVVTTRAPR